MKMKSLCFYIFVVLIVNFNSVVISSAMVLDFDSLSLDGDYIDNYYHNGVWVNTAYGGLSWYEIRTEKASSPGGYLNGTVSGEVIAYNSGGYTAYIYSNTNLFDFNGAFLTGAWKDGLQIQVDGYLGDSLIYTQTVTTSAYTPNYFVFDYIGIDVLKFRSFGGVVQRFSDGAGMYGDGDQFAMDNFTFNMGTEKDPTTSYFPPRPPYDPSPVPEPATILLFATGIAGLAAIGRRKRS